MRSQAAKRIAEEKRRNERRQRHLQEDLRYALKKLPEPLDLNLTYEQVRTTSLTRWYFMVIGD